MTSFFAKIRSTYDHMVTREEIKSCIEETKKAKMSMLDGNHRFVKLLQDFCMLFLSFFCRFFKLIMFNNVVQVCLGLGTKRLGQGAGKIVDSVKIIILARSFEGLDLLCLHDQASSSGEDKCLCQILWQSYKTVVDNSDRSKVVDSHSHIFSMAKNNKY